MRISLWLVLGGIVALCPVPCRAQEQAQIVSIVGPDGAALPWTEDVQLYKLGAPQPRPTRRDAVLAVGDQLLSRSGNTTLGIACSDSAGITFSGQFRIAILQASPTQACFVQLYAGTANVQEETATGLGLGDKTLGPRGTQYSATIQVDAADNVTRDVQVFDGEVVIGSPGRPAERVVPAGTALAITRGTFVRTQISPQQLRSVAFLFATVDASTLGADQRPQAVASLTADYQRVLAHPDSVGARIDLVRTQLRFRTINRGTLYHINRLRTGVVLSSQLDLATAAIRGEVYRQVGDSARAAASDSELRGRDTVAVRAALEAHRFDPALLQGMHGVGRPVQPRVLSLVVQARADPPTITTGVPTRILVKVTTPEGDPLGETRVKVEAGGGTFPTGGTSAAGITNAAGTYVTSWTCRPCAQRYILTVTAVREGFAMHTTSVTVNVR